MSYKESGVINLTALTMSPHVGTHTDAPIHCYGDLVEARDTAGMLPLDPYLGRAAVVDIAPFKEAIRPEHVKEKLERFSQFPPRVLFRTTSEIRYEVFEETYAHFSVDLVTYLSGNGVVLIGIDTPSADHAKSKTLAAHHALIKTRMYWLENLDLTHAAEGEYFLIALPLKFMELEASPVRAVLLSDGSRD